MASITAWTRLELKTLRDEPDIGLQARVRDPLWFMARQWQFGEFSGEDAGSPVQLRVCLEGSRLSRYMPGAPGGQAQAGQPYNSANQPLEALVEAEPLPFDLRRACESGLHFLRLLDRHGVGKYRADFAASFPIAASPGAPISNETARLLRLAAGRAPDGQRLAAALRSATNGLPAQPTVAAADQQHVRNAAGEWLAWLASMAGTLENAPIAWDTSRMEYAFSVAAPAQAGEYVLGAAEFPGGQLDWHAFDQLSGATLGAQADQNARTNIVRTVIPAPVSYRGMPTARWWEFEDGQVNFGRVDAGPRDLLRLLMLGFALDYGNDWFLASLELPAGAIYRVASLVVTDGFGQQTLVQHYTRSAVPTPDWRMYSHTANANAAPSDVLLLVPSLAAGLHGEPIEEVALLRDELANMAWAVERLVEDRGGRPYNRYEQAGRSDTPAPPNDQSRLHYRLATPIPPYWIPLVPARIDPLKPDIRLLRGRVLTEGADEPIVPPALGRILEPDHAVALYEEEVQRAGARITRAYQYARWIDGSGHLWIARRKGPGHGEASSRLRFDILIEPA